MFPADRLPLYSDAEFVYEANKRTGDTFFPSLTIESINVYDVLAMCSQKNYNGLTRYLSKTVNKLAQMDKNLRINKKHKDHVRFSRQADIIILAGGLS